MAKAKQIKGTVIDKDRAAQYHVDKKTKTASGRASIDSNDSVAKALRGKTHEELSKLAKKNEIDFAKWKHLNPGMQRMCLGNVLRGKGKEASL